MLIRVVKKGNRDMCAVSGLPASTEEWKRFDRNWVLMNKRMRSILYI